MEVRRWGRPVRGKGRGRQVAGDMVSGVLVPRVSLGVRESDGPGMAF